MLKLGRHPKGHPQIFRASVQLITVFGSTFAQLELKSAFFEIAFQAKFDNIRSQTKAALKDDQRRRALVLLRRSKKLGDTLARLETILDNLEGILGQIEDARTNEQVT